VPPLFGCDKARAAQRRAVIDTEYLRLAGIYRAMFALCCRVFGFPITRRVYNLGLDEFIAWFTLDPGSDCQRSLLTCASRMLMLSACSQWRARSVTELARAGGSSVTERPAH
jgi:hypothetical protein